MSNEKFVEGMLELARVGRGALHSALMRRIGEEVVCWHEDLSGNKISGIRGRLTRVSPPRSWAVSCEGGIIFFNEDIVEDLDIDQGLLVVTCRLEVTDTVFLGDAESWLE